MGEDLSTGMKIGISAIVILAVVAVLITIVSVSQSLAADYVLDMTDTATTSFGNTIRELSQEKGLVSAPTIWTALNSHGSESIALFTFDYKGNRTTYRPSVDIPIVDEEGLIVSNSPKYVGHDILIKHFSEYFYVDIEDADDGLHVWVGDTR